VFCLPERFFDNPSLTARSGFLGIQAGYLCFRSVLVPLSGVLGSAVSAAINGARVLFPPLEGVCCLSELLSGADGPKRLTFRAPFLASVGCA